MYDLRWFLLPDVIVFPLVVLAVVQVLGLPLFFDGSWSAVLGSIIGVAVISGLFYLIFGVSKGKWIGFGDVKLGIVLGLLAGGAMQALLVLFPASLLGMLVSLPLVISGKASRKSHLPFGPLLIAGMIMVALFGQGLIDWYPPAGDGPWKAFFTKKLAVVSDRAPGSGGLAFALAGGAGGA